MGEVTNDQDTAQSPSTAGYVPSELDERIVLELPASMVRPLRVTKGTFQASLSSSLLLLLVFLLLFI